jgi:hypothetical protein
MTVSNALQETMVALIDENVAPVARMSLSKRDHTIGQLLKKRGKARFDLAIQRNNVWDKARSSMLIHSILEEFPIPTLYTATKIVGMNIPDDIFWFIDGKQRLNRAIFGYIDGDYALDIITPPVTVERSFKIEGKNGEEDQYKTAIEMVDVAGKHFSELDDDLQKQILGYSLTIVDVKNATPAQIEELFQRLYGGMPLTKIELTRALSGTETMNFVNSVTSRKFFEYMTINTNRHVDYELTMQIMMLTYGCKTDIGGDQIREFAKGLREVGLTPEWKDEIHATMEYMEKAFEIVTDSEDEMKKEIKIRKKILKKVHIPNLFMTAKDAMQAGVDAVEFGKWAKQFLTSYRVGDSYGTLCSKSSAKWSSVGERIRLMKENAYRAFGITANAEVAAGTEE